MPPFILTGGNFDPRCSPRRIQSVGGGPSPTDIELKSVTAVQFVEMSDPVITQAADLPARSAGDILIVMATDCDSAVFDFATPAQWTSSDYVSRSRFAACIAAGTAADNINLLGAVDSGIVGAVVASFHNPNGLIFATPTTWETGTHSVGGTASHIRLVGWPSDVSPGAGKYIICGCGRSANNNPTITVWNPSGGWDEPYYELGQAAYYQADVNWINGAGHGYLVSDTTDVAVANDFLAAVPEAGYGWLGMSRALSLVAP